VKWVNACRSNGSALVSIGGSSLKVWDPNGWICVQTVNIQAKPDNTPPHGLPPGMFYDPHSMNLQPLDTASDLTMQAASLQPIASSFYAPEPKPTNVASISETVPELEGVGSSDSTFPPLLHTDSLQELPSAVMEDMVTQMPSLALSVPKSLWAVESRELSSTEAGFVSSMEDTGVPLKIRGLPPHFPHHPGTHSTAEQALQSTKRVKIPSDTLGVLEYEPVDTVMARPRKMPITDNDFRVALPIEVRGALHVPSHRRGLSFAVLLIDLRGIPVCTRPLLSLGS
jgi:hypothetical protein